MTKLINPRDIAGHEQIYTHIDTSDNNKIRHFAVNRIWEHVIKLFNNHDAQGLEALGVRACTSPIIKPLYDHLIKNGGVEEEHIANFPRENYDNPLLVCRWEDETTTIIDGAHRYVKRYRAGEHSFRYLSIPLSICEKFLVDLPEVTQEELHSVNHAETLKEMKAAGMDISCLENS